MYKNSALTSRAHGLILYLNLTLVQEPIGVCTIFVYLSEL